MYTVKILPLALLISSISFSQEKKDKEKFTIDIIGDSYFKTNINSINKSNYKGNSPATSFAKNSGFALGMINSIITYKATKTGIVLDVILGPRAEIASSNAINQLYCYYNFLPNFKITFGKFNTFLGYELISPKENFNYSTSYLFSNGPFSHTGIKVEYDLNKNQSLLLALMNANDDNLFNNTETYTIGFQYKYKKQYLNIIYGDQDDDANTGSSFQIDYTGGLDISNSLSLGFNISYNTTKTNIPNHSIGFYGAALYTQIAFNKKTSLGLRSEYFTEFIGSTQSNTLANTLSANISLTDNLKIIPELRIDTNKNKPFVNQNLNPQKSLSSFLVGIIYNFKKSF